MGLAALVDSLRREGEQAFLFRPRDLHHYVNGLLLQARGDDEAAIAALRRANAATASDFVRVNAEMARLLLRRDRPGEAVAALRPAARGWFLETTNLHVTVTEMHELLAEAWDAAGVPDSAQTHWARVARAWGSADGIVALRRARAVERLEASARRR
jgi:hypothetical protein